jgi:sec-independent protein translocase protein TatA
MSLFHWLIVLVVVIVLFGAGKIPRLADDVAKGIKAFRQGMRDDEPAKPEVKTEIPPHEPPA